MVRITASEAAAILGECEYRSPEEVFVSKVGLFRRPRGERDDPTTRHGEILEPLAIAAYARARGVEVRPVGLVAHPEHAWLSALPDGLCSDGVMIEVKCPPTRAIDPADPVPRHYVAQLQVEMQIFDLPHIDFVQAKGRCGNPACACAPAPGEKRARDDGGGADGDAGPRVEGEPHVVRVARDDAWFAERLARLAAFRDHVARALASDLAGRFDRFYLPAVGDAAGGMSGEQRAAVELFAERGRNVLITGPGGTGKTFCFRNAIAGAKARGRDVLVCAPTASAADNLEIEGAGTIHRVLGVVPELFDVEATIERMKRARGGGAWLAWLAADAIAVDEVSMVDDRLFDLLDGIGRRVGDPARPFGGIQLLLSADFMQLPPVARADEEEAAIVRGSFDARERGAGGPAAQPPPPQEAPQAPQAPPPQPPPQGRRRIADDGRARFAFESRAWSAARIETVHLLRAFRQSDAEMVGILNAVRFGRMDAAAIETLRARVLPAPPGTPGLTGRIGEVDAVNRAALAALPGREVVYAAVVERGGGEAEIPESFLRGARDVALKVGAPVILTQNRHDLGLYNGMRGVVEALEEDGPVVRFPDRGDRRFHIPRVRRAYVSRGRELASRAELPMRLSYCLSVHSAQGRSMTSASIDLGFRGVFSTAQAYVALSRVRSLGGLYLTDFDPATVVANPRALHFYARAVPGGLCGEE